MDSREATKGSGPNQRFVDVDDNRRLHSEPSRERRVTLFRCWSRWILGTMVAAAPVIALFDLRVAFVVVVAIVVMAVSMKKKKQGTIS